MLDPLQANLALDSHLIPKVVFIMALESAQTRDARYFDKKMSKSVEKTAITVKTDASHMPSLKVYYEYWLKCKV